MYSCTRVPLKPAWYELGVRDSGRVITIGVSQGAYKELVHFVKHDSPVIKGLLKLHKFEEFIPPTEAMWGFEGVLQGGDSERNNWRSWEVVIPQIIQRDEKGEKRKGTKIDFKAILKVVSSLSVLLSPMFFMDENKKGDCVNSQLVEYDISPISERGQSGMSAGLSPLVIKWLREQDKNTGIPIIDQNMRNARMRMRGLKTLDDEHDKHYTGCRVYHDCSISFSCSNDASGLDPDSHIGEGGFELHPHNVDNAEQTIVLLAGVVTLEQLVRESLKKT